MCCVEFKVSIWSIWSTVTKSFKSTTMSSTNLHIKSMSEITLFCWILSCTEKLTLASSSSFSRISTHTHPLSDSINFITGIFLTYQGLIKWTKSSCSKILDWFTHFHRWIFSNILSIGNLHLLSLKLNNFTEHLFQKFLMWFRLMRKMFITFLLRKTESLLNLLAILGKIIYLDQQSNALLNNQGFITSM